MRDVKKIHSATLFLSLVALAAAGPATAFAASAPASAEEPSQLWRFVARFHSVLLHFPIGFLGLAFLLELYSLVRPNVERARTIFFVLLVSSVTGCGVAALGLMLAGEGGYDAEMLSRHQWLGLSVVVLAAVTTVAQWHTRRSGSGFYSKFAYRGLLCSTAVVLVFAGHEGGNLTHGSQYLVKYAPPFVKTLMARNLGVSHEATATEGGERGFIQNVRSIFEAKCTQCHGPEKQKGDYRLDVTGSALRGGESGLPAIVPGDAFRSNLVRLILLPQEHDDVMPPAGKELLSPEEIGVLVHWVQRGAAFFEEKSSLELSVTPVSSENEGRVQAAVATEEAVENTTATAEAGGSAEVDFARDIQPILEQHCLQCHSAKKRKGRLGLHTGAMARKGGKEQGPAILPGKAEESPLYVRIALSPEEDEDEELMPPEDKGGPLNKEQVHLVRRWIHEGAAWPDGLVLKLETES